MACPVNTMRSWRSGHGEPRRWNHRDDDELLHRVDPEEGAGRAAPVVLARRGEHAEGGGVRDHAEAQTEAHARERLVAQGHARAFAPSTGGHRPRQVIRRHELNGLRPQDAHPVQTAAVAQHFREAHVVPRRGDEAAAAGEEARVRPVAELPVIAHLHQLLVLGIPAVVGQEAVPLLRRHVEEGIGACRAGRRGAPSGRRRRIAR